MKATEFDGDLEKFLAEYCYQPELTKRLDLLRHKSFSQETINEIVLWKVNRYVRIDNSALQELENLKKLKAGEHKDSISVLPSLLEIRGIDLPMASTILRFLNPMVFQIIDRHAYRAIYGQDYPLNSTSAPERKTRVYFDYLDQLIYLCQNKSLDFQTIDRLLYMFDKRTNGKLS